MSMAISIIHLTQCIRSHILLQVINQKMNSLSSINHQDSVEVTIAVVFDSVKNIIFLVFSALVIYGLLNLNWWLGIIPFWIFIIIGTISILQYVFAALLWFFAFIVSILSIKNNGLMTVGAQAIRFIATSIKLLEGGVYAYVILRIWNIAY